MREIPLWTTTSTRAQHPCQTDSCQRQRGRFGHGIHRDVVDCQACPESGWIPKRLEHRAIDVRPVRIVVRSERREAEDNSGEDLVRDQRAAAVPFDLHLRRIWLDRAARADVRTSARAERTACVERIQRKQTATAFCEAEAEILNDVLRAVAGAGLRGSHAYGGRGRALRGV